MTRPPRAASFDIYVCPDPACGIHVVYYDPDEEPICEAIMEEAEARRMIEGVSKLLYQRAAIRDDANVPDPAICAPEPTFRIAPDGQSITFQPCGTASNNMNDVRMRHCARCHRFLDDTRGRPNRA